MGDLFPERQHFFLSLTGFWELLRTSVTCPFVHYRCGTNNEHVQIHLAARPHAALRVFLNDAKVHQAANVAHHGTAGEAGFLGEVAVSDAHMSRTTGAVREFNSSE